jgi:hypothetical protein
MAINAEWVKGTVTPSLGLAGPRLVEDDNKK